ncbi:NlpC/P60 family protein [Fructilactobacillus hinvesii]|uniref:NlpC/P60 family protein n=1 Tax=Fructilactobacillus hinvesii TaxID=2940300 RepID=A0ABY5BRL2_9LACO|nr:NlpC/P60 family protein [Fructilactobacillus hinvesii]USS87745.1 NlpC/P60 family protein [Fructilactobacillus hinvesii]
MKNTKVHFKMYKAGKKWLFAGIATSMMAGAFFFAGNNTASADVLSTGQQHVGTSYAWGGSNPGGFDCSGFTQYVYGQNGVSLPRTAAAQAAAAQPISASEAQAGDLVFFNDGSGIYHVGIYQGNGQMLDAQNRGVISGDSISYFPGQVTYGRIGGGASAAASAPAQTTQAAAQPAADNSQAQTANTDQQAAAQPAADNTQAPATNDDQQAVAQPAADTQAQPANDDQQAAVQPAADTQAQPANDDQQAAAQPDADNSQAQTTNDDQQAAAQPAADNTQAPATNDDQQAAAQPAAEAKPVLTDAKLVSQSSNEGKFNPETGYFTNGDTQIAVRESASLKAKITGYLPAGAKISYDGYVVKDGHVWVEYTGYSGNKLYCPVRETQKVAWGSFE